MPFLRWVGDLALDDTRLLWLGASLVVLAGLAVAGFVWGKWQGLVRELRRNSSRLLLLERAVLAPGAPPSRPVPASSIAGGAGVVERSRELSPRQVLESLDAADDRALRTERTNIGKLVKDVVELSEEGLDESKTLVHQPTIVAGRTRRAG